MLAKYFWQYFFYNYTFKNINSRLKVYFLICSLKWHGLISLKVSFARTLEKAFLLCSFVVVFHVR